MGQLTVQRDKPHIGVPANVWQLGRLGIKGQVEMMIHQ